MKRYRITAIRNKARRIGAGYLDDCKLLAESWDEEQDIATYTVDADQEIKATWHKKYTGKRCKNCGGL